MVARGSSTEVCRLPGWRGIDWIIMMINPWGRTFQGWLDSDTGGGVKVGEHT